MLQPDLVAPASEWLVFGDALQEAGDPRGELIGLSIGVDEGRTEVAIRDAYVAQHAGALLGGAAVHLPALALTFRFSEIVGAQVRVVPGDDPTAIVGALLAAPRATALATLEIVAAAEKGRPIDLGGAVQRVAGTAVKRLALVDERAARARMLISRDFAAPDNLVSFGSLALLWPHLEELRLVVADSGQLALGESVDAPELRRFELACLRYGDGYGEANPLSAVLGAARWPKLERFALRLAETFMANTPAELDPYIPIYSDPEADYDDDTDDGENDGVDWRELDALLANLARRPLTHLALTSYATSVSLIEAIVRNGLARSVVELDLSDGRLAEESVAAIVASRAMFARLERLVIQQVSLTDAQVARLRAIGPEIIHSAGDGARYRYLVGAE